MLSRLRYSGTGKVGAAVNRRRLAALCKAPARRIDQENKMNHHVCDSTSTLCQVAFGTTDPARTTTPLRGYDERIDDFGVELVDGVGHWFPEQRPKLLLNRLRVFLHHREATDFALPNCTTPDIAERQS
jgi:hypothetical protein